MTSVATGVKKKIDVKQFIFDINTKYAFFRAVLRDEWKDDDTATSFMKRLKFSASQRPLFYTWIGEKGIPSKDHFDTFRIALRWEGEKLQQMESLLRRDNELHTGRVTTTEKNPKVRAQDKAILLKKLERTFDLFQPGGRLLWIVYCVFDNSLIKFDEAHPFDVEWYEKIYKYSSPPELEDAGLVDFMNKKLKLLPALTLWVATGFVSDVSLCRLIEEFRQNISPPVGASVLKTNGSSGS